MCGLMLLSVPYFILCPEFLHKDRGSDLNAIGVMGNEQKNEGVELPDFRIRKEEHRMRNNKIRYNRIR